MKPPLQRNEMAGFRRRRNRLEAAAYRGRGAYFLTLCVRDRKRIFHDQALVDSLLALLEKTCAAHLFIVYAYCFMPDHLHLILIGESGSSELAPTVRAFKGAGAAVARKSGVSNLWQKGYYDHVLRSGKSLDEAAWYVFLNPVRAGLVKTVHEWPHSGSFVFEWTRLVPPSEAFRPPWKDDTQSSVGRREERIRGKMAT
jgi:putative transposase